MEQKEERMKNTKTELADMEQKEERMKKYKTRISRHGTEGRS